MTLQWEPDGAKAAIVLPTQINGHPYRFEFDTGATANIIYSKIADRAGWSKPTDHSFQPKTFAIADTTISRPWISIFRDMKVSDNISGTLGLWSLLAVRQLIQSCCCGFLHPLHQTGSIQIQPI